MGEESVEERREERGEERGVRTGEERRGATRRTGVSRAPHHEVRRVEERRGERREERREKRGERREEREERREKMTFLSKKKLLFEPKMIIFCQKVFFKPKR